MHCPRPWSARDAGELAEPEGRRGQTSTPSARDEHAARAKRSMTVTLTEPARLALMRSPDRAQCERGRRPKPGWVPQGPAPSWDAGGKQAGRAPPDRCRAAGRVEVRASSCQGMPSRNASRTESMKSMKRGQGGWECGGVVVFGFAEWPRMGLGSLGVWHPRELRITREA